MIQTLNLTLNSKSTEIRRALDQWRPWLHQCFGESLDDLVQLRFNGSLTTIAMQRFLGSAIQHEIEFDTLPEAHVSLKKSLKHIEFPPGFWPAIAMSRGDSTELANVWDPIWLDCPVALHFSGTKAPVLAFNVPFVDSFRNGSSWREVVLAKRDDVPHVLRMMEEVFYPVRKSGINVIGGSWSEIRPLKWEELTLHESIVKLIKEDFLLFLKRKEWFLKHQLPFRRGYLLHGPPGNGKSSVIRAMLSTEGISALTINPFQESLDTDRLELLFSEAARRTPSLVILEDLDRCYPRESEPGIKCAIPLQQLLNHLDGVGSQDGIIVVATANNPKILDPAILRRPGRFDRVVGFPNPDANLRKRYLEQIHGPVEPIDTEECVRLTEGFSFAQLREVYVLAGQSALDKNQPLTSDMLVQAVHCLIESMSAADKRWNLSLGFREIA